MFLTKITDTPFTHPQISLTYEGGVLTSAATTDAVSYQRFLGNDLIEGADSPMFTPTQIGNYTVVAAFGFGCSDSSSFNVTELSVGDFSDRSIMAWPNPMKDVLHLERADASGEINLFDLTEKNVATYRAASETIDVSQLQPGVYLLKTKNLTLKLMKI